VAGGPGEYVDFPSLNADPRHDRSTADMVVSVLGKMRQRVTAIRQLTRSLRFRFQRKLHRPCVRPLKRETCREVVANTKDGVTVPCDATA
jgi:hypothetical protein